MAWVAVHTVWSAPTGTQNVNTFSEVMFHFRLTSPLLLRGLALSLAIGVVGGFLPALRASRLRITTALRAA
jgi:ABC-type antimicrobial peptide transport system permease subunit